MGETPDATRQAIYEEGYENLLGQWTTSAVLPEETDDPKSNSVNLTYVIPVTIGTRTASHLENYISEAQTLRRLTANVLWAYERDQWKTRCDVNGFLKTLPYWTQNSLKAGNKQSNVNKVAEAFNSWDSNDRTAENSALPTFGSNDFLCIRNTYVDVWDDANGVTLNIGGLQGDAPDPGRDELFDLVCHGGEYQQRALDAVSDGVVEAGRSEIHKRNGEWFFHLTISYDRPQYNDNTLDRWIGIDLGTVNLYTAAVVERTESSPKRNGVDVVSKPQYGPGTGLMETRRQQLQEHTRLQKQYGRETAHEELGKQLSEQSQHLEHEYANDIIRYALEHAPCGIVFENLKGVKGLGWSHLWAYFRFKETISYKAEKHGIPIVTLDKSQTQYTSLDCSACGQRTGDGDHYGRITRDQFHCDECGYGPMNADKNAAINIAIRHLGELFSL
ncbi:transposase [Halocatena halophila]|uniref:transposase n=1 Tax=Halocatena halophila TaxID=2814576 RepID=UPI002ED14B17